MSMMQLIKRIVPGKKVKAILPAKAIEKAKAVIRSCETSLQLSSAQNYIELVNKKIGSKCNELEVLYQNQFQNLKG